MVIEWTEQAAWLPFTKNSLFKITFTAEVSVESLANLGERLAVTLLLKSH